MHRKIDTWKPSHSIEKSTQKEKHTQFLSELTKNSNAAWEVEEALIDAFEDTVHIRVGFLAKRKHGHVRLYWSPGAVSAKQSVDMQRSKYGERYAKKIQRVSKAVEVFQAELKKIQEDFEAGK